MKLISSIAATMMQNRSSILKSGTKNIFLIELANSFSHELHKTVFFEQEKFRELKAGILIDKTETMGKNAHFPNYIRGLCKNPHIPERSPPLFYDCLCNRKSCKYLYSTGIP